MLHLTAHALPSTLLFHDWYEALELWRRLSAAFPDARALCLMPNHLHVLPPDDRARERLSGVMSGYARWRGHRRRQDAGCWLPQPPAQLLPDREHVRRTIRYVLLNPCRGGLVADPLAWPLSSHRDLVGLGDPRLRVRDPEAFHRYVSGDPTVAIQGTELPRIATGEASLPAVEAAVSAILRLPVPELRDTGLGRRMLVRAAWYWGTQDCGTLGAWTGVTADAVRRLLRPRRPTPSTLATDPVLAAVIRVTGDPRFPALLPRRGTRWNDWILDGSRGKPFVP